MKPTILHRTMPVCPAENVSVEKLARTHSQISVGTHRSILRPRGTTMRVDRVDVDKRACLLDSVIGSLTRDDDVMHVALTQARSADADKLRFLLQLRNGFGAAITHART